MATTLGKKVSQQKFFFFPLLGNSRKVDDNNNSEHIQRYRQNGEKRVHNITDGKQTADIKATVVSAQLTRQQLTTTNLYVILMALNNARLF